MQPHGLPATVRRASGYSDISMVEFASVDVRMAFLNQFGREGPRYYGRRIRVTPSTPLFARKREGVLRVIMAALNDSEQYADAELTPLWHSLTLMAPQPKGNRVYDPDHDAWAFVKFVRTPAGRTLCEIHLDADCQKVISRASSG